MSRAAAFCVIACIALARPGLAAVPPDAEGCKDFFVTRLAGYYISDCTQSDFDAHKFMANTDNEVVVEGKVVENHYRQPDDATPNSALKVERNYESALQTSGWTIVSKSDSEVTAKQIKNGQERWVELTYNGGSDYYLDLAQKGGVEQSVVTADDIATALNGEGQISLHINFDTGKSTIKPDSQPIVDQIIAMMKANPSIQLSVEGHTDNVGSAASNKTLSQARAQAVVDAVVRAGVAASRMTPVGYGQDKPVADNATEDGRAQNRRVVLVKR